MSVQELETLDKVNEKQDGYSIRPGYKQTEVGLIPDDWSLVPLRELGVWFSGGTPSKKNQSYWVGDVPWVSPKDMKRSRLYDSIDHISDIAVRDGARLLPAGTILIVIRGMILVHSVPIGKAERPLTCNQDIKALVPSGGISSDFILYWLTSNSTLLMGLTTESTHGTKRLPPDSLLKTRVPLPTNLEQEAIAEALGDADALVESLERLLAKKRNLKQAAMQQLLTGKKRLPGFDGGWETRRIGDVADTDPENLGSNTSSEYLFKYISLEDVDCGFLRSFSTQQFQSAPSRARRVLHKNDVLLSTVRPNLQSHLWFKKDESDWVCSTGFCVIRCRENVSHPGFIFQHLFAATINSQINALLAGSNYPAINSGDAKALDIPFPSFAEQTAIATALSDMDDEIAATEAQICKAQQIKTGMMQELLTGKTRLA